MNSRMKKIAIVSFFKSENYGALLQAFALQKCIEDMGYEAGYLEYHPHTKLPFSKYILNRLNRILRSLLGYRQRRRKTKSFVDNYIRIIPNSARENQDVYVAGSDQVWHPQYLEASNNFFILDFIVDKPKISYASSFGISELPKNLIDFYKISLSAYAHLSVREETGLNIIKGLGFNDVVTVCDPTMLLSQKIWMKFIGNSLVNSDYILSYVMNGDNVTAAYIRKLAQILNAKSGNRYKLVFIGDKEYKSIDPSYSLICNAGPIDFINYIYHAKYIITSSFHGTCFSLIFNKQFLNILDANNGVNNRITNLIDCLEIPDVVNYTIQDPNKIDFHPIDYSIVAMKIEQYRNKSWSYLKNSLNDL